MQFKTKADSKIQTIPVDDRVTMESRDIFSAWPILFNGQKDFGGLIFDRDSQLQPPFDGLNIIFRFYIANSPDPAAPYRHQDVVIATVLSWKLTAAGLWIRGGFAEPPGADSPYLELIRKLKAEIKKEQIGLTYSTLRAGNYLQISTEGHVSKLPIVAFNLYERDYHVR